MYSFIYQYSISTCLVCDVIVIWLVIHMGPTLSTLNLTGSLIDFIMLPNNWITNIPTFTASDKASHSAFELDSITLFWAFDCQETGTFRTLSINPVSCIVTITDTSDFPGSLIVSNFNPSLLVSSLCLITCSNTQNIAGFSLSFTFDSSLVALAISGLKHFKRNNIMTLDWYSFWSSVETFSLSIMGLTVRNFSLPDVLWLYTFLTHLLNFFSKFSMRWGCTNQAHFLSSKNLTFQDK